MSYEIGTAANYLDLLERLKEFMTDPTRAILSAGQDIDELVPISAGDAWTVKRWDLDWDGNGNYELILAGPGVSGADDIMIGFQSYYDLGYGIYNWLLGGFTGFSAVAAFEDQPGSNSTTHANMAHTLLNNSSMEYWFFANGRRACGVAKVGGTYYASFHLGYILPYGVPNAFPYPLMIGGSAGYSATAGAMLFSNAGSHNRGYTDPYESAAFINNSMWFLNGLTWLGFGNYHAEVFSSIHLKKNVWPYIYADYGLTLYPNLYARTMDPDPSGDYAIYPLMLNMDDPNINMLGEMHGVYAVPGNGVVTEDTITIDGDTYIVFQNGRYQGSHNFYCIKKE